MPRERRRGKSQNWKFVVGIAIGLLPIIAFGGAGVDNVTAISLESPLDDDEQPSGPALEETFSVSQDDMEYLNRIYTERNHEIGYCVSIDDDGAISFWLADTVESTESSLQMKTTNCPPDMTDATAHTHPSGSTGLSEQDKSTLLTADEDVMCIHSGELERGSGAKLDNLNCYQALSYDDVQRIDVQVADSPSRTQRVGVSR